MRENLAKSYGKSDAVLYRGQRQRRRGLIDEKTNIKVMSVATTFKLMRKNSSAASPRGACYSVRVKKGEQHDLNIYIWLGLPLTAIL